jgi:exodeoxyribonuclease III
MVTKHRLRIVSFNLNGIRAAERRGFLTFLAQERPDILCVQETRIDRGALTQELERPLGYEASWAFPLRKGYSGVATFSLEKPLGAHSALGEARFDEEGRVVVSEYASFLLCNVYFPKGSGTLRDNSRVPYKLAFYDAFFAHVVALKKKRKKPVIVLGDFNTAHMPIDLKNWRTNQGTSGFLPEERLSFERHLEQGFVDTFRALHPTREQYSWWSQRLGARDRNVGWRIDYVWVSSELMPKVKEAFIWDHVRASDHCPVGIDLEL